MNEKSLDSIITPEEWAERTRELLKPIDFDALIEAGIIEKRRGWYKVLKYKELPSHAVAKIRTHQSSSNGEILVKFEAPSKSLEKKLKEYEARKK